MSKETTTPVIVKTFIEGLNEQLILDPKIEEKVLASRELIGSAYCKANETRSKSLRNAVNDACDKHGETSPQAQKAMKLQNGVRGKVLIFGNNETVIPAADVDGLIFKHEVATEVKKHTDLEKGKAWIAEYKAENKTVQKLKVVLYDSAVAFKAILAVETLNGNMEGYKKVLAAVAKSDFWNTAAELMLTDKWPTGKMDAATVAGVIFKEAKKSGGGKGSGAPQKEYKYEFAGHNPQNAKNTDNIGEIVIAIGAPEFDYAKGTKHVIFKGGKFDFAGWDTLDTVRKVKLAMKEAGATMEFPTVTRTNVADGSTTVV